MMVSSDTIFLAVLTFALSGRVPTVHGQCATKGTTPDIGAIVIGKCSHFQQVLRPDFFCGDKKKNCTDLWNKFSDGLFYKPPCNVNRSALTLFTENAVHDVTANKSMFWEGVYEFVHRFSAGGKKYLTLEDTLTGYMMDGLRFCGKTTDPGFNSDYCASFEDTRICVENSEYTMWTEASKRFAQAARGRVHVMLNGTSWSAFSNDTIFATWEFSQMQFPRVSKLTIILAYSIGQTPREFCNSSSLKDFQSQLDSKKIPWDCQENPPEVKLLLCEEDPGHPDCQLTIDTPPSAGGLCRPAILFMIVCFLSGMLF